MVPNLVRVAEDEVFTGSDLLERLVDIQQALLNASSPEAEMELVIGEVQRMTGAAGAALGVMRGNELVFLAASGLLAEHQGLRLPQAVPEPGSVWDTGRVVRAPDLQKDARGELLAWRLAGAKSALTVPVHRGREVLGALTLVSPIRNGLGRREEDVLRLVAGMVARALVRPPSTPEANWELAFQCSPVPLAVLTREGQLLAANPALCDLSGCSARELEQEGLASLLHPDERAEDRVWMQRITDCEVRSFSRKLRCLHRRGGERLVLAGAALVRERSGRVLQVVRTFQDITDEHREQQRRSNARGAASASRLAAAISQAMRVPLVGLSRTLGGIGDGLRGARTALQEADLKTLSAEALELARRLQTYVKELEGLAQAEERRRGHQDVRTALDTAAGLTVEEIRTRARLLRAYAEVPAVEASEPHLVQLFAQVLLEAVESIPAGEVEAHELELATFEEQGVVMVEVRERAGPGARRRLPAPETGNGTRLGLPVLQGLVEAMGGALRVDEADGVRRLRVALPATG